MTTLRAVVRAINAAERRYGQVKSMIPAIKKAEITADDLRRALQEAWGFSGMKPGSRPYNATKQRVAAWIATIYGGEKKKQQPRKASVVVTTKLTSRLIDWLLEQNIAPELVKQTALALANNIA